MSKDDKTEKLHKGHRQRKREALLNKELDALPPHEVLETFLFYAIPQKDTNELGHRLLERFGSLNGVLNASYKDLLGVNGVGDYTAGMFCFFRMLSKLYLKKESLPSIDLYDSEAIKEFCTVLFIGSEKEEFRIIFVSDDMRYLGDKLISVGTPGSVNVPFRNIVEDILEIKCSRIIITHNHPVGMCIPSSFDVNYTKNLWKSVSPLDIGLIDHVIVGSDGVWSMRQKNSLPEIWG